MHALSGQDILRIWELCQGRHPIDRALTILAVACPEMSRDALIKLSVGQRDAALLSIREQTFGPQLSCRVPCPACDESLSLSLNITDIRVAPEMNETPESHHTRSEGYELHFRLPNSADLAAVTGCADAVHARNLMLQRCVLQATRNGIETAITALPESVLTALAGRMGDLDPQAEIQLNLNCPACGHHWQIIFDIVSFLWTEISAQTKRLLREVHTLAEAYGWREADILSMSAVRRQFYLEMVT